MRRGNSRWRPGRRRVVAGILVVAAVIGAVAMVAVAAADNGTIKGVIKDTAGVVIAGAKVTAENSAASLHRETVTDKKGAYKFEKLPVGAYRITAELAGFQTARYTQVELASGKSLNYDFSLNAGATTEIVELGPNPIAVPDLSAFLNGTFATDAVATAAKQKTKGGFSDSLLNAGVNAGASGAARNRGLGGGGFGGGAGAGMGAGMGAGSGGVVGGVLGGQLGGVPGGALRSVPSAPPPPPAPRLPPSVGIATVVPADLARAGALNGVSTTGDNPFISVGQTQLSTFSSDVDTASYANVRRFLTQNQRPPRDSVRIEELINYFSYDYPIGSGGDPITGNVEVASAPWNTEHRLVRIGVRAKPVPRSEKAANLVFLIDVSGSMNTPERLPLLKSGLRMLVDRLTENDMVSIVTYSGAAGVALQPISGDRKEKIIQAIEDLRAEGSTNGGAGIQTAYDMAVANFIRGGVNRVILATDGDFNVGVTNQNDLVRLIEGKAKSGVFLSVLGVGKNFKDTLLEKLADKGNGNYAFIDTLNEARRVLLEQMDATFITVAKDVKIQVEFNPERVSAYRLIGYEDRVLANADFNNDLKDAGDMGAGHTVTAFYELVPRSILDSDRPAGEPRFEGVGVDPLRYRQVNAPGSPISDELLDLKIRYKEPEGLASKLIEVPLVDRGTSFAKASPDFRFAAAVAAFGMILRDSPYRGTADWEMVRSIASDSKGKDRSGYRSEFIQLTERATGAWRASLR